MSKQNTTEMDAFVKDENIMASKRQLKLKKSKTQDTENDYPCIGGTPKGRREYKIHMDMMKKMKKGKIKMEYEDD